MQARGLILAAPASGSGKTLLTAGLLRHLRRRGVRVAAAKAGPDFIDPTFHALASGAPCINLDPWAMRPETLAGLVAGLEAAAEIVLCEGVMGLFDGTGADGEAGSTAELARLTGWPVVLVVDARGQGASVAALLRGFAGHRPEVPIAGVIFNRIASERHRAVLAGAARRHLPGLAISGRFLPTWHWRCRRAISAWFRPARSARPRGSSSAPQNRSAASLDIDRLLALARPSTLSREAVTPGIPPLGRRIAVARDDAFCFIYPALLDGWRHHGADLTFFSPLADESPDPAADAVYLPGGYPELWAGRIAAADVFFAGLRRAAAGRKPIYGECGGYMVLGEALIDADGHSHPMAGLLPVVSSFTERRLSLGYRCATLLADGPLGRTGSGFRGHEFHYATIAQQESGERLWSTTDAAGTDLGMSGLRRGSVFGSFLHLIDRSGDRRP